MCPNDGVENDGIAFDDRVIPTVADRAEYEANIVAIDHSVRDTPYRHAVAWGKWLGFRPGVVTATVRLAEAENAPLDVVQKVQGRWVRLADVANEANRETVDRLARVR